MSQFAVDVELKHLATTLQVVLLGIQTAAHHLHWTIAKTVAGPTVASSCNFSGVGFVPCSTLASYHVLHRI
jgi:hypothetical protein